MKHGVRVGVEGGTRLRAVTHLDDSAGDIVEAADALATVMSAGELPHADQAARRLSRIAASVSHAPPKRAARHRRDHAGNAALY